MSHSFFINSLTRSWHLSLFWLFFNFTLWSTGTAKSTVRQVLSLFIIFRSGHLFEMKWSVWIIKSQGNFWVSFSRTNSGILLLLLLLLLIIIIIIIIIIIYSFRVFHISVSWRFFYWSLCDSKSPQVSRTRLRILAVLSNAVVWIVSTRPPTPKSSRPFNNPLVIVSNAPITIGRIVTFMFHSFFNSLASTYPSFHFPSVLFCRPPGQQSVQFCRFSFFCCWLLLSLVIWPGLGDPFVY